MRQEDGVKGLSSNQENEPIDRHPRFPISPEALLDVLAELRNHGVFASAKGRSTELWAFSRDPELTALRSYMQAGAHDDREILVNGFKYSCKFSFRSTDSPWLLSTAFNSIPGRIDIVPRFIQARYFCACLQASWRHFISSKDDINVI